MSDTESPQPQDDKHLTFVIGEDAYAVHISCVTEIIEMQTITAMPNTPPHVRGIINLRGQVIPVVDVRISLGLPERTYDSRTCIVVVHEESPVGLVVDTVREVVDIPSEVVKDAPVIGGNDLASYVVGIAKMPDQTHILLDSHKLLGTSP